MTTDTTEPEQTREDPGDAPGPIVPVTKARRLLSLDAFRGFDIAAMLLVNLTWDKSVFHPQLFHVDWNAPRQGATFTDLVFPWFLFIAGAAIPLSMRSGRGRSQSGGRKVLIAFRRAMVLYLLGVLLTVAGQWYDRPAVWKDLFSWNILQLIGWGYFAAVCVFLLPRWAQVSFVVVVLGAKWLVMAGLPYEIVTGPFSPRGAGPGEGLPAPTGPGTFEHFDAVKRYLAAEHLEPTVLNKVIGWLGMWQQVLPLAAVAVCGGLTTDLLRRGVRGSEPEDARTESVNAGLALGAGALLVGLGYVLQWGYRAEGGGLWGAWTVPFSKWFISPAYCLLSAGTGMMLYAGFFYVIDARRWTGAWALRVYGLNAIALYLAAELSFKILWARWQMPGPGGRTMSWASGSQEWLAAWLGRGPGLWAHVLLYLGLWWVFCWWLYRRKWFFKV
ncbi:MAG: heparan-alpha-glucosaminide N-acetyltransferase domain-containing protein [Phycisphaerales bacterium JB040]